MDNRLTSLDQEMLENLHEKLTETFRLFIEQYKSGNKKNDFYEADRFLLESSVGPLEFTFSLSHNNVECNFENVLRDTVRNSLQRFRIKLWLINDAYWYAAESKESALKKYVEDQELSEDEPKEIAVVPDSELDEFIFEEDEGSESVTFRHHLNFLIFNNTDFPCVFAFKED